MSNNRKLLSVCNNDKQRSAINNTKRNGFDIGSGFYCNNGTFDVVALSLTKNTQKIGKGKSHTRTHTFPSQYFWLNFPIYMTKNNEFQYINFESNE